MKSHPLLSVRSVPTNRRQSKPPPPFLPTRAAVTLMELLIAISIIGLLLAILAPAVMWSREASRRAQCLSHLRQMGVAIHAFQSAHEIFPRGANERGFSLHVSILPFIDQAPLFERLKTSNARPDSNEALSVLIPAFICPSDPSSDLRDEGGQVATNYVGNYGTGIQKFGYNGVFGHGQHAWSIYKERPIRPRDIRDGLSQTAMLSEILSGDGSYAPLRTHWHTDRMLGYPDELDEFAEYCEHWPPRTLQQGGLGGENWFRGRPWTWGQPGQTWYNHVLTPNQLSCFNQNLVQEGIYTAASLHRGGVNVLYADGRATFVSETVDHQVWRDWGSRGNK